MHRLILGAVVVVIFLCTGSVCQEPATPKAEAPSHAPDEAQKRELLRAARKVMLGLHLTRQSFEATAQDAFMVADFATAKASSASKDDAEVLRAAAREASAIATQITRNIEIVDGIIDSCEEVVVDYRRGMATAESFLAGLHKGADRLAGDDLKSQVEQTTKLRKIGDAIGAPIRDRGSDTKGK